MLDEIPKLEVDNKCSLGFSERVDFEASCIQEYLDSEGINPGDTFPSDAIMCEAMCISRSSYREVVSILSYLGYVTAKHGKRRVLLNRISPPLTSQWSDHMPTK